MAKKVKEVKEDTNGVEELKDKDFRIKNFKEDIDKYIKERVNEETKKGINIKEYKDQIDKYTKERVEIESSSQSVKLLKKQLHDKKVGSAIKSFIILCLLGCIGYGIYYLYQDGYFEENKGIKCPVNNCAPQKVVDPVEKEKGKEVKLSLKDLEDKYSYLLDNIIFDANSNYTRDYYSGNLTNEIKLYLAYKLIDKNDITINDDSVYFDAASLMTTYKKLFDDEISLTSFKFNNASYIYLPGKEIYITNNKSNEEKNVSREIIDIDVEDETITITCVEGLISSNNKLYNILTNKEINGYKSSDTLSKYKDKLNLVKYVFEDNYLKNITK